MKKLLGIAVCALVAASLTAGAAVTNEAWSKNVSGVANLTLVSQFNMIGYPFKTGDNGINTSVGPRIHYGADFGTADRIYVWDTASQGFTDSQTFWLWDVNGDQSLIEWYDNYYSVGTLPLEPGLGFWYENIGASSNIVFAGNVSTNSTVATVVATSFNMLSAPFSGGFDINNQTVINEFINSGAHPGADFGTADRIYVWDAATQGFTDDKTYWLYDVNGDGSLYRWYDNYYSEVTTPIPVGTGFWYENIGSGFTLTNHIPYSI